MSIISKKTLTVEQVGEELNISRASAYTLVKKNNFPKIFIGKRIVIPIDAFNEWIKDNTEVTKE